MSFCRHPQAGEKMVYEKRDAFPLLYNQNSRFPCGLCKIKCRGTAAGEAFFRKFNISGRNTDNLLLCIEISVFLLLSPLLLFSGCSGSGGGASGTDSGLSNTPSDAEETALFQDSEEGIAAGLNLNENISEEALITSNGEISWTEGLEGEALLLDEDGEFLSLPDSDELDLPGNGAISVWVNP